MHVGPIRTVVKGWYVTMYQYLVPSPTFLIIFLNIKPDMSDDQISAKGL